MAEKLFMMALSPTMSEGTIARWRVAEGEAFTAGQLLCEVETDKASMDYEAPKDARLLKILLPQGGRAAIGDPIAIVGAEGENIDALLASADAPRAAAAPVAAAATPADAPVAVPAPPAAARASAVAPRTEDGSRNASPEAAEAATPNGIRLAPAGRSPEEPSGRPLQAPGLPPSSPLARDRARGLGVDIRGIPGSGPGGRVVLRDVEAAGAAMAGPATAGPAAGGAAARSSAGERAAGEQAAGRAAGSAPADRRIPLSGKRAVIARRLSESFFAAPHYYLKRRVAMERLLELRASLNRGRERPVSLNAFIVKLCAEAIARHPYVNSSWEGDSILERGSVDVALAVALPDGLVTPVVRDCGSKGVGRIDEELSALIDKAKGRGLAPEDYEGASFTISNLGSYGVEEFTAIINPPGSAILAVGAALRTPVALEDGSVAVRRLAALTLGCDHRVIDGAAGAEFLATLARFVEEPALTLA
ncbi:MAG TPA: dihydrolipoamide acetyltransferase family protein [Rectinemataceae bacterium]|nr:dihydrolipoamide acetyltransferase family protein [Rectinemataceae bacterium]